MPKVLYENELVRITETGRDYDFIGTVQNKAPYPIEIEFIEEGNIGPLEAIRVGTDDWLGILASDYGREQLEAIKCKAFNILEGDLD